MSKIHQQSRSQEDQNEEDTTSSSSINTDTMQNLMAGMASVATPLHFATSAIDDDSAVPAASNHRVMLSSADPSLSSKLADSASSRRTAEETVTATATATTTTTLNISSGNGGGSSCSSGSSGGARPRLTLSAFKRPEHTVRLTKSDPSRLLETEYTLRSPGCGILGHGAFSTVIAGRRRCDNRRVAVKSIAKYEALRARRLRRGSGGRNHLDEWEILQKMNGHPFIVQIYDVFETDEEIHLVTEYCEGGELFDVIQKKRFRSPAVRRGHYSEEQAACITQQLLIALRDLHDQGIVHRDLKPENIVLVSDDDSNIHAKLCDFGMARCFVASSTTSGGLSSDMETPPSTPGRKHSFCAVSCDYYAAPEVCSVGLSHKPSADVYSLGVTLYILLCGFPPLFSDEVLSNYEDESDVLFPELHWSSISESARQLLRKMLHADPARRITAKNALQDAWILQYGKASLPRSINAAASSVAADAFQSLSPAKNLDAKSLKMQPDLEDKTLAEDIRNRLFQALSRLQDDKHSGRSSAKGTSNAAPATAAMKRRGSGAFVSPRRKRRRGSMDGGLPRRRGSMLDGQTPPRRRASMDCQQRRSSLVCAMKELYCDMASVSAAAEAAAEGIVCKKDKKDVRVLNPDVRYKEPDEEKKSSQSTYQPHVTLSV